MENTIPQLKNEDHYCKCGHQRKDHNGGSGKSSFDPTGECSRHLCKCERFDLASGGVYGGPEKLLV